jgi:hypothetical protein
MARTEIFPSRIAISLFTAFLMRVRYCTIHAREHVTRKSMCYKSSSKFRDREWTIPGANSRSLRPKSGQSQVSGGNFSSGLVYPARIRS